MSKKCKDCKRLTDKNDSCYGVESENNKACDMFIGINGLTEKENSIMDNLIDAWNEFCKLETQHPEDIKCFGDSINKARSILGLRTLRRDYPNLWKVKNGD